MTFLLKLWGFISCQMFVGINSKVDCDCRNTPTGARRKQRERGCQYFPYQESKMTQSQPIHIHLKGEALLIPLHTTPHSIIDNLNDTTTAIHLCPYDASLVTQTSLILCGIQPGTHLNLFKMHVACSEVATARTVHAPSGLCPIFVGGSLYL